MDSELGEVRESIASVLAAECPSLAVHAFIDRRDVLGERLWGQAIELGWLAMALPEAQGGLGLSVAGLAALHFELGRVAAPGAFIAASVGLDVLVRSGTADGAPVAKLIANVLAGSATLAIAARAEPPRRDAPTWLLGEVDATAAMIAGEGDDLLLIEVGAANATRVETWDETRSMIEMRMPAGAPLATLPGMRPTFEALFAIALAADSAGAARGTLDRTVLYMKEREQFGRPIGSFQALKHRAADHHVNAIIAEQLVAQAIDHLDAASPGMRLWPALAKANVTEKAMAIAGDCVQLHGGVGFTREYDPHLYLKRVRLNEMLLAPNSKLRDRAEAAFAEAVRHGFDILEIA